MDDSNYDEFGNYLGPDVSSSESDQDEEEYETHDLRQRVHEDNESDVEMEDRSDQNGMLPVVQFQARKHTEIVLHEDKNYYPDAEEVFGPDVEVLVNEEDTQPLSEPIIAPIKDRKHVIFSEDLPETTFEKEFLVDLMGHNDFVRQIAIVGHLHHGKTSFVDMLVASTHTWKEWDETPPSATNSVNNSREPVTKRGYTTVQSMERKRGLSTKAMPMSLVMTGLKDKSYVINLMDTPGHVNFIDEVVAGIRLADGIVLVVDAIEGVMINTEQIIKLAVRENVKITLVINKVDRLILELKIPPKDAYYKLKHTVEEVNTFIGSCPGSNASMRLSPELGNVCFASSEYGWCFSLDSFAKKYVDNWKYPIKYQDFAKRLWGDIYYNKETRKFVKKSVADSTTERSFIHFIMEPLYKLHAQVVGEDEESLRPVLEKLGINLKKKEYGMNVPWLLRRVMGLFFGPPYGFVDMVSNHIPSPVENAENKVRTLYTGEQDSEAAEMMRKCSGDGPLIINVVKMYPSADASELFAFGRIYSGSIKTGQSVMVLGEGYIRGDDEEMVEEVVEEAWIFESRYRISVSGLGAGTWVLLKGVDNSIAKTATITTKSDLEAYDIQVFRQLQFPSASVMKVAIEPLVPSELPKMLSGLRKISKVYPSSVTKVEESGEHVVLGTGELYLDCIMHDLRLIYSEIDIKVSDSVVAFRETISETSAIKCFLETPNKRNKLTMICEPLDKQIVEDLEIGNIDIKWPTRKLGHYFEENFGWDILASRSIWAFGPELDSGYGTNVFSDDTLPLETDKVLLRSIKESVKQGFLWSTKEGPLVEEQIRGSHFKLLGADLASEPIFRGSGQIIPTIRKLCYGSFLSSSPKILEPVYAVEVQTPADCVSAVYTVLAKRRGHVTSDTPKPGSPLYSVKALLPTIDSFGFETDLRIHTNGQAFCQMIFSHYQVVPGNPLDKSIPLKPLEPSSGISLARDFMVKTRRRKGLSDDVSIEKYLDDPLLLELAHSIL
ncbi:hypothetical protein BB559_000429 [Furculomyces boomerangus]|uniref:Tr-type G domain-containing protein n=2 Tax=Harpellales TaxID=61421 RepID=A0A2T9Z581_9FUNG|nr:hypothetical protein BB559_000429 [Furculomyces boomerangus]PWA00704.1 hypothetical protein BB558_003245 [Smittium angustum]